MVEYYSVVRIINLHGRITGREYVDRLGIQLHPMIQSLFLNNNTLFQEDSASVHTAGTVQSWFEEHESELQHRTWPAQPPDLNIIETLWSVLDTRLRNRIPSPISLKQLEGVRFEVSTAVTMMIIIFIYESVPIQELTTSLCNSCTLKMEAIRSSETSVLIRATRCHLPEDDNHQLEGVLQE
jgi:hypothetical protein